MQITYHECSHGQCKNQHPGQRWGSQPQEPNKAKCAQDRSCVACTTAPSVIPLSRLHRALHVSGDCISSVLQLSFEMVLRRCTCSVTDMPGKSYALTWMPDETIGSCLHEPAQHIAAH